MAENVGEPVIDGRPDAAIWILTADITSISVEVVVATDDTEGIMWGDSANAIKLAAGAQVERASQELGPHPLCSAWDTDVGELVHVRRIVHVAVTEPAHETSLETIRNATLSALNRANGLRFKAIAFPAMGAGTGGRQVRDSVLTIVSAARSWFASASDRATKEVVITLYDQENLDEIVSAARA